MRTGTCCLYASLLVPLHVHQPEPAVPFVFPLPPGCPGQRLCLPAARAGWPRAGSCVRSPLPGGSRGCGRSALFPSCCRDTEGPLPGDTGHCPCPQRAPVPGVHGHGRHPVLCRPWAAAEPAPSGILDAPSASLPRRRWEGAALQQPERAGSSTAWGPDRGAGGAWPCTAAVVTREGSCGDTGALRCQNTEPGAELGCQIPPSELLL